MAFGSHADGLRFVPRQGKKQSQKDPWDKSEGVTGATGPPEKPVKVSRAKGWKCGFFPWLFFLHF